MRSLRFAATMAAVMAAGTARQNEFVLSSPTADPVIDMIPLDSRPYAPVDRLHRKAAQGYTGAEIRAMNAVNGVGRPPRNRRP